MANFGLKMAPGAAGPSQEAKMANFGLKMPPQGRRAGQEAEAKMVGLNIPPFLTRPASGPSWAKMAAWAEIGRFRPTWGGYGCFWPQNCRTIWHYGGSAQAS